MTMYERVASALGKRPEGIEHSEMRQRQQDFCAEMARRFLGADPKGRVKWAGPDMSVLSSITARLMETWAHSQAIYDMLGHKRVNGGMLSSRESQRVFYITMPSYCTAPVV